MGYGISIMNLSAICLVFFVTNFKNGIYDMTADYKNKQTMQLSLSHLQINIISKLVWLAY